MTKLNMNFETMFIVTTRALRVTRAHPYIEHNTFWKCQFVFITIFLFTVFCLLSYSVLFHDIINHKFAETSRITAMVILDVTVALKYSTLLMHRESVQYMIQFLENDYSEDKNNYTEEDKDTVLEYAKKGVRVTKIWLYAAIGTSIIFPSKAFVTMIYYYFIGEFELISMFDITYPQPIEEYKQVPIVFCSLFSLAFSYDFFASTFYVGFDPLVPIFMLHICGQLIIMSRRIGRLFTEYDDSNDIKEQLKIMVIKLQSLYNFMDSVKHNFSVLYECNMKATTFLLPLVAFQIITDLRRRWISVEFIAFIIATFLHFFIPCYYSDLLMEKSEDFRQAIYSSGWEKCPDLRARQIILFMLTRARIPIGIRTVFYEINLDTFSEMCRQAYTLLNLMNAAWS